MTIFATESPSVKAKIKKEKLKAKKKAEKEKEEKLLRRRKAQHIQYNKALGGAIENFILQKSNLKILEASDFYFVVAKNVKLIVTETNPSSIFMPISAPAEKWYTTVFKILYGHSDSETIDESKKGSVYNAVSSLSCKICFIMDESEIEWVINKTG